MIEHIALIHQNRLYKPKNDTLVLLLIELFRGWVLPFTQYVKSESETAPIKLHVPHLFPLETCSLNQLNPHIYRFSWNLESRTGLLDPRPAA